MPETQIKKSIRTTVRSTVTFTEKEVEAILREYVKAPANAEVSMDCGYDGYFKEATVTWEVVKEDFDG